MNTRFAKPSRNTTLSIKVALAAGLLFLAGFQPGAAAAPASAGDETFPPAPFLGMQLTYSLAGANWEAPLDKSGAVTARIYRGVFAGDTLVLKCLSSDLTGTCHAPGGDSFIAVKASLWVDGERKDFASKNPCEASEAMAPGQTVNLGKADFSLSLPIPAGASEGGFLVRMTSVRNGSKVDVLEIGGVIGAPGKPLPEAEDVLMSGAAPISGLPDEAAAPSGAPESASAAPQPNAAPETPAVSPAPAAEGGPGSQTLVEKYFVPLAVFAVAILVFIMAVVAIRLRKKGGKAPDIRRL